MNVICKKCGNRMRRIIKPMGYWCPFCNKIFKDNK